MLPPGGPPPGMMPPSAPPMGGPPLGGPPGMPPAGPVGVPSGAVPNPAFAQWMQMAQARQAIVAKNAHLQAQFDAAVALIRKDGVHGFRLDIEADSTIAPDEAAEKQARVEFMQQFIPLMQQVVPIAQGNPALAALAKEAVLFAVRGFRVARPMEETIEQAFDAIGQMPPNPNAAGGKGAGAQQNPQIEQAKVAADVHDTQMRTQSETQTETIKAQTDQMAIAQKAQEASQQAALGAAKLQAENQRAQETMAMQAAELQQRGALEQARMTALQSRAARGLV